MPIRYVCKHCGYVIWEFKQVGQDYFGIPTPSEIMLATGGICPNCKRELSIPTLSDIRIRISRPARTPSIIYVSKFKNMEETSNLVAINRRGEFMAAQEI